MLLLQYSPLKLQKITPYPLALFGDQCAILPLIALKSKDDKTLFHKCRVPLQTPPNKRKKTQMKNHILSSKHSSTKRQNNLKSSFSLKQKIHFSDNQNSSKLPSNSRQTNYKNVSTPENKTHLKTNLFSCSLNLSMSEY